MIEQCQRLTYRGAEMRDDPRPSDSLKLEGLNEPAGHGSDGLSPEKAIPLAQSAEPAVHHQALSSKSPRRAQLRAGLRLGAVLLLGAASYYGHYWWTAGRYLVMTDDAYVGAKNATLSPKVSGYVTEVAIDDNAQVKAGDVLVR